MQLRNRDGVPVDPVPFVVVVGLAFMLTLSFGPLYGQAYGLSLRTSIAVSASVFLVAAIAAYHWFVWSIHPESREVPMEFRAARLFYAAIILGIVFVVLTVPILL